MRNGIWHGASISHVSNAPKKCEARYKARVILGRFWVKLTALLQVALLQCSLRRATCTVLLNSAERQVVDGHSDSVHKEGHTGNRVPEGTAERMKRADRWREGERVR